MPALLTRLERSQFRALALSYSFPEVTLSLPLSPSSSSSEVMRMDSRGDDVGENVADYIENDIAENFAVNFAGIADEAENVADMEADDGVAVVDVNDIEVGEDVGGTNAAAVGAGNVFAVIPFLLPVMNKSVLWDLEAPLVSSLFDKYRDKNNERCIKVSRGANQLWALMEGITADRMEYLSNEEALLIVRLRLKLVQRHKNEYQQLMEEVEGAAWHFRDSMLRLNFDWDTKRLDRAVVNYFLSMRYLNTAGNFAATRHMQDTFHFETYFEAERIVRALRNRNLDPAKDWCNRNAPWSKLDFHLLCQEYIEYVRANDEMVAISFAWKFTSVYLHFKNELQQVLAAVAFGSNTQVLRYKKLFDEKRWEFLVNLFEQQFNLVQRYTKEASSLCILLESGITALKVPFCYDDGDCKKDDPLECEYFRTFASSLPLARPFSPNLLCHVTKKPLTKEHPPLMLPNGYAYSKEAILQMQNGDEITCPRTGSVFKMDDVKLLKFDTKW